MGVEEMVVNNTEVVETKQENPIDVDENKIEVKEEEVVEKEEVVEENKIEVKEEDNNLNWGVVFTFFN